MIETIHRHIQIASIDKDMNNVYYKYYVNLLNEIKKDCKVGYDFRNTNSLNNKYSIFVDNHILVSVYTNVIFINIEHVLYMKDDIYKYIILYIIKKHFNDFNNNFEKDIYTRTIQVSPSNIVYENYKKIYLKCIKKFIGILK